MPKAKQNENTEIDVVALIRETADIYIVGTEPLIFNAMSAKARQELLSPRGRKTAADKATTTKHNPLEEYQNSVYASVDPSSPTVLEFPMTAFKGAMGTAALRVPGVKKTEIEQLVSVPSAGAPIFGVPLLYMAVVRSADMNHTPDIRTRALVRRWATKISLTYIKPQLNAKTVGTLLAAAGMLAGVGDFRQEKGKGSFGMFRLCTDQDPEYQEIVATGGRAAQEAALQEPGFYDLESDRLYHWWLEDQARRGAEKASAPAAAANGRGRRGKGSDLVNPPAGNA